MKIKLKRLRKLKTSVFLIFLIVLGACEQRKVLEVDLQDPSTKLPDQNMAAIDGGGKEIVYRFGFDLRASPQEDAQQYLPFLKYLQKATGEKFELDFTPKGSDVGERLGKGKVHFAAMGAVSYIMAEKDYGAIILARGLNLKSKANYYSKIVVNQQSRISKVGQLKGKRFAFGSVTSTQGHLVPKIMLLKAGLKLKDLKKHFFSGSHKNCADAVITGVADACGMQDTLANYLEQQGKLKILTVSEAIPSSGIAANKNLSAEIIKKVQTALLDFKPATTHKTGLYNWERTEMPLGFQLASKSDYDQLKEWMNLVQFSNFMLNKNRKK